MFEVSDTVAIQRSIKPEVPPDKDLRLLFRHAGGVSGLGLPENFKAAIAQQLPATPLDWQTLRPGQLSGPAGPGRHRSLAAPLGREIP